MQSNHLKPDNITVSRITGLWCLEYDCWPEDHPGCDRRYEKGCDRCLKSIKKTSIGQIDERNSSSKESVQ